MAEVMEKVDAWVAAITELEIPALSALQTQGDLAAIPLAVLGGNVKPRPGATWTALPAEGLVLVEGTGGHVHRLLAGTGARYTTDLLSPVPGQEIAVVDLDEIGWVQHDDRVRPSGEHATLGLTPGRWLFRRQVEWAEQERRLVAD